MHINRTFTLKHLKSLQHVSVLRSSSGSYTFLDIVVLFTDYHAYCLYTHNGDGSFRILEFRATLFLAKITHLKTFND